MKNLSRISTAFMILIFGACSKSNDKKPDSGSLPKTYTEDIRSSAVNSYAVYNLTYDGNNRLISMATAEPSVLKFIYQYPTEQTVTMDMYNSGELSIHENLFLNASLLIDSSFQYNDTEDTTTEKYTYNNGQLVQKDEFDYHSTGSSLYNSTTYSYDSDGNLTTESDNQGKYVSYAYYSDLPYTLSIGLPYIPAPKYFIKYAATNAGSGQAIAAHYYTFDSSNRLIRDSAYVSDVDVIAIKSYTY